MVAPRIKRWIVAWCWSHVGLMIQGGLVGLAVALIDIGTRAATLHNDVEFGMTTYAVAALLVVGASAISVKEHP